MIYEYALCGPGGVRALYSLHTCAYVRWPQINVAGREIKFVLNIRRKWYIYVYVHRKLLIEPLRADT